VSKVTSTWPDDPLKKYGAVPPTIINSTIPLLAKQVG